MPSVIVDGVIIASNKGNILYWTSLLGDLKLSTCQEILPDFVGSNSEISQYIKNVGYVLHINRGGCLWMITTPFKSPTLSERLSLIEALHFLHSAVYSSLRLPLTEGESTTSAPETVSNNIVIVHQIVSEVMLCGVLQVQPLPRILSQLSLQREHKVTPTNSLFGVVRVPSNISQHLATMSLDTNPGDQDMPHRNSMSVDVVERVSGSASLLPGGGITGLTGCTRGSVTVSAPHHLLNRALTLSFNREIPSRMDHAGGLQLLCTGPRVSWDSQTLHCAAVETPNTCLLQYTVEPCLPCALRLVCKPVPRSSSDFEIIATIQGTIPRMLSAPHLTLYVELPPATLGVTPRYFGHSKQTVVFSSGSSRTHARGGDQLDTDLPYITWTIKNFPGDGEAKSYIRVLGCGNTCQITRAKLDFEVSQWLCSELRVQKLAADPPLPSSAWIRYLTIGERFTFALPST